MAKLVTGTTITNLTTGEKETVQDIGAYMEQHQIGFGDYPKELAPGILDEIAAAHRLLTDTVVGRNGSISDPSTGLLSASERDRRALEEAHPSATGHQLRQLVERRSKR